MTKKDVLSFLKEGESQSLEFKESFGEEALETICAFANADGGVILVGVKDSAELVGLQVGRKTMEDWAHQINSTMDPRIKVDIKETSLVLPNKLKVMQINVPQAQFSAVSYKGRFFRRVGKTNQKMTGEDIAQKLMASTKLSWDSGFEDGAKLSDLDSAVFDNFVTLLNSHTRRSVPTDISMEALLSKLNLSENGKLTRAAVLLFGSDPQRFYPNATLKLARFKSPTQIQDEKEIRGCLLGQMNEALTWIRERLSTTFEITKQSERKTRWEYPLEAIREALANAICHRDYRIEGNIQIRLFDTQIEFWNPGSLLPGLSIEDLLKEHESRPRNTKIADIFYNTGYIEKWGTGTLRMDEFLRTDGHPGPEFEATSTRFRLRFRRTISTEYLMSIGLNERQIHILLNTDQAQKITNNLYCEMFKVNKRTASRELSDLLDRRLLKRHGSTGKGTFYTRS